MDQSAHYRELLSAPIRECASYTPKFGHSKKGGYSLAEFEALYGGDAFYSWLGLNDPIMYLAHKASGGITSIYRQIGIGCERLVRAIFVDHLGLTEEQACWSYQVQGTGGKERTLSLDGRIVFDWVRDSGAQARIIQWKQRVAEQLAFPAPVEKAMTGVVFEVRQGYKSKDSKRQNADLLNASNAYASGYMPCLMVLSSQIDEAIVNRYRQAKWAILQGYDHRSSLESTYAFFQEVIGFDLAGFMSRNQSFFQSEIRQILHLLMRAQ